MLDFSRKEIRDHVFDQICSVLDQGKVDYIKWDMNRSISDIYSSETKEQGKVLYDYVLGVYDFLERLLKRYPDTLIEGCSGGGGRFDAGMLYYTLRSGAVIIRMQSTGSRYSMVHPLFIRHLVWALMCLLCQTTRPEG